MNLSIEFWIQIVVYAVTIGSLYGSIRVRLNYIEKKLEKHNNFSDRLVAVEHDTQAVEKRVTKLEMEVQ